MHRIAVQAQLLEWMECVFEENMNLGTTLYKRVPIYLLFSGDDMFMIFLAILVVSCCVGWLGEGEGFIRKDDSDHGMGVAFQPQSVLATWQGLAV